MTGKFAFTPWNATKFFVPLSIQAMSQCLTYPLVGIVVAHGAGGANEFSAFAQGQMVMFLLGTLGYGLVTTGMVYAKDRIGYKRFVHVNTLLMLCVAALQVLLVLPGVAPLVFGKLLGLEGMQLAVARWSLLTSLPAQMSFYMRNIPQVILYNEHETSIANAATILRIIITASLAPLFYWGGLVGWGWGAVCFNGPVILEAIVMWWFARPYVRTLPLKRKGNEKVTVAKVFFFNIPLSLGGCLLMGAVFILNAIINRTPDGADMLAIHLVAVGLINPLSYGALRNQAVAIGFPQTSPRDNRTFLFSICSGVCLSMILLLVLLPGVSEWYFCHVQNLKAWQEPLACNAICIALILPIVQSMRGHAEGLAASRKRPKSILIGQATFLVTLVMTLGGLFVCEVSGYMMGVIALCVATALTLVAIRVALCFGPKPFKEEDVA